MQNAPSSCLTRFWKCFWYNDVHFFVCYQNHLNLKNNMKKMIWRGILAYFLLFLVTFTKNFRTEMKSSPSQIQSVWRQSPLIKKKNVWKNAWVHFFFFFFCYRDSQYNICVMFLNSLMRIRVPLCSKRAVRFECNKVLYNILHIKFLAFVICSPLETNLNGENREAAFWKEKTTT